MGPDTPLRVAGPADVEALVRLIIGFRDFLDSTGPDAAAAESVLDELLRDPATEFLVAGDPGDGFAQVRYRKSVWNGNGAEDVFLEDVYVDETARGRGLGKLLMEGVIARARARGAARIQLDANRRNLPAISLYRSVGFVSTHNPAKWGDGEDLYFTLNLD